MSYDTEKHLIDAIKAAAAYLEVDPVLLGADVDRAMMSRLKARGYTDADQVPGELVEPILMAVWHEAISLHAPRLSDAEVRALVARTLNQIGQAIARGITLN